MKREEITVIVKKILSETTGVEEHEIKPFAHFREDLGVSPFETAEVFSKIEQHFKISLPKNSIRTILEVNQLIDLIEEEI